jgi:predicted outer membrane repeat protein
MWRILWPRGPQKPGTRRPARYRPCLEVLEGRCLPSRLTVTNTADSGPGSLRAEIAAAQSGDTIVFDPSLAGQTISLTSGELVINTSLDIEGLGGSNPQVVINAASSRIFDITNPSANVTIANLGFIGDLGFSYQVTQGADIFDAGATLSLVNDSMGGTAFGGLTNTAVEGGAIYQAGGTLNMINCQLGAGASGGSDDLGGDIYNAGGVLNVTSCVFSQSIAVSVFGTAAGGDIYDAAGSTVTITNSTFQDSQLFGGGGDSLGGAVYQAGGSLTITGSSFLYNSLAAAGVAAGGAIYIAGGNVSMVNSSIVGNNDLSEFGSSPAAFGGGVYLAAGNLSMTNCTVSGNMLEASLANGGGVYQAAGNLSLTNCVFSNNVASDGGAIYQAGGTLTATNCMFSNDYALGNVAEGGALYIGGTATIQTCAFDYDSAIGSGGGGFGGAIFVAPDGSVTISGHTTFLGDFASTAGNNVYIAP